MPHTPGHEPMSSEMLSGTARTPSSNTAQYKIYGTDEPYNGLTVEIGGFMYSTVGGALEGNSYQLTPMGSNTTMDRLPPPTNIVTTMGGSTGTNAQEMGELGNMGAGGGISPNIGNQGGGMSGGDTGGGGY